MSKTWTWVAAAGAASCVAVGLVMAQGGAPADGAAKATDAARAVAEFGGYRSYTKPSRDATLGFSLPTRVLEVNVKGGQEVKQGDLLLRGDDREDEALLKLQKFRAETELPERRAKATMDLAQLEFKRLLEVAEKGSGSPQEIDRARLNAETATADYQLAIHNQVQEAMSVPRLEARVSNFRLAAPFDGQVDEVKVDVGQTVGDSEKVIRVVNVDPLWIDVPASMSDSVTLELKVGAPAWVLLDIAGRPRLTEGRVVEVSPVADFSSNSRRIRVEVGNPPGATRVVAGGAAYVRFQKPTDELRTRLSADAGERR